VSPGTGCIIIENTDIKMCPSEVLSNYTYDVDLLIQGKSACRLVKLICNFSTYVVGPCHHGMARPQVADRGTASDKEGSCE